VSPYLSISLSDQERASPFQPVAFNRWLQPRFNLKSRRSTLVNERVSNRANVVPFRWYYILVYTAKRYTSRRRLCVRVCICVCDEIAGLRFVFFYLCLLPRSALLRVSFIRSDIRIIHTNTKRISKIPHAARL